MKEMTTQDIVKTEVERTMPGTDWRVVYAHIHEMVKSPKHRIFRANNSLFIITNNGDHTADVSMCNADSLQDMPKSLAEFCKAMKACGFTEVRFTTNRPAMLRMVERAGYKAQVFPSSGMASDDGKPVSKVKVVL
jgi:hypothetical protein